MYRASPQRLLIKARREKSLLLIYKVCHKWYEHHSIIPEAIHKCHINWKHIIKEGLYIYME